MPNRSYIIVVLIFLCIIRVQSAHADEANKAAQANNPLADLTAVNFHYYYIGELTEPEEDAHNFFLRFAKPFSLGKTSWLQRVSLPISSFPTLSNDDTKTGLGDLNLFSAYLLDTGKPGLTFGFGPEFTFPTATEATLGTEKWSAGFANVLFSAMSKKYQYGYLLTWEHSFAGAEDRPDVNRGAFQPFGILQLGGGTYLRSTGIWTYNFENDTHSVPLGLGIGQVIPKGKTVYNLFVEPQYSVADEGPLLPKWQIFFGFNMQFYG